MATSPLETLPQDQPGRMAEVIDFHVSPDFGIPTSVYRSSTRVPGTKQSVAFTIESPADEVDLIDDVPVLILHGLAGVEPSYGGLRHALAQMGKRAVTWKPVRSGGGLKDLDPRVYLHPSLLASRAGLGVARGVEEYTGHGVFDGFAHSNGGQTATDLAIHRPKLFRTITMASVVGLDPHNLGHMVDRLAKFGRHDFVPSLGRLANEPKFIRQEVDYFGRNLSLTFSEAISAGTCNLHERINRVKAKGIPVAAIQFALDDFHPADAVTKHSSHLFDAYSVFKDPTARHTAPQTDPEGVAEAHLELIVSMLEHTAA